MGTSNKQTKKQTLVLLVSGKGFIALRWSLINNCNHEKLRHDRTVWSKMWCGGSSSVSVSSAFGKWFWKSESQGNSTLSLVSISVEAATWGIRPLLIIQAEAFLSGGLGQGEEWVAGPWISWLVLEAASDGTRE